MTRSLYILLTLSHRYKKQLALAAFSLKYVYGLAAFAAFAAEWSPCHL